MKPAYHALPGSIQSHKHMPQLDSLRAFAVAGVLLFHFHMNSKTGYMGVFGVRLFFVLSGFLITGILLECRALVHAEKQGLLVTLKRFYLRRFLRIVPVFYLFIAIACLLGVPAARDGLIWHLLYVSNFYIAHIQTWPMGMSHLWSLAVEEQFYFVWPLLICMIPTRRAIGPVIVLVVVALMFLRGFVQSHIPNPWYIDESPLHNIEPLGLGSLLAVLWAPDSNLRNWVGPLTLFAVFAGVVLFVLQSALKVKSNFIRSVPQDLIFGLIGVWMVAAAARGFTGILGSVLLLRPIRYIGTISYGIYLYHNVVPFTVQRIIGHTPTGLLWEFAFALITFAVAVVSWHLFESPVNSFKKHFPYNVGRSTSLPVDTVVSMSMQTRTPDP